ncbi:hypothetical protein M408DRAFT_334283 [Serendipita vermifera MAFF 305830]|uniref:Uncharacterized protein n=1 Tax=Serendipita vermifera MAFF 305830 TaxID=933852 RepID=A0A0C3AKD2_SERVB|nr:hypothetical protein M408DRAFT_334286 [Serendipita vermifera MAFF 305830]KIM19751.1 hypothetical protein M408DRAFT_334283 [Serendipita vermifera MAFF 305830]
MVMQDQAVASLIEHTTNHKLMDNCTSLRHRINPHTVFKTVASDNKRLERMVLKHLADHLILYRDDQKRYRLVATQTPKMLRWPTSSIWRINVMPHSQYPYQCCPLFSIRSVSRRHHSCPFRVRVGLTCIPRQSTARNYR